MYKELDSVVLTHNIEEHDLEKGDVGVIVQVYANEKAYEVEFTTTKGKTVAVLTLTKDDIRSMREEILHVRGFAAS